MVLFGNVGVILTTVIYIRRHKNQIQVLQVQKETQAGDVANFVSLINSEVGISYVYIVFLICYLPHFISLAAFKKKRSEVASFFSLTLLDLNPLVTDRKKALF